MHAQFRTPRVTYSVQFQNGGFWLSDQNIFHTVSLNFHRVVPVSCGFYVASHSGLSWVLKPQNLNPANFNIQPIVEYTI
jgi:hypothetical protein